MSSLFLLKPKDSRSVDSLLNHIAADYTQPYRAFFSLTTHVPFFCAYVLYVGSILIRTDVKNLLSLISTTCFPTSGISTFRKAPGKSIHATALLFDAANAATKNTLLVLTVGDVPLSYISLSCK